MILGTGLLLVGTISGWQVSHSSSLPGVRFLRWWVGAVMLPLLRSSAWWRRTAVIFINNISILALLVFLGRWPLFAALGIAGVGLAMGIALRALAEGSNPFEMPVGATGPRRIRRIRIGLWMNMLEPLAIVVALGMALGRVNYGLSSEDTWLAFAVWITPPMFLAACGEALWMGECMTRDADTKPKD
jgi:hypothetical protein